MNRPLKDRFDDIRYGLDVRDIRDALAESYFDRRILILFPVDDQFPSLGYTYSQLASYLETRNDFWALEHREGVEVFGTSEDTDRELFQDKLRAAREKNAAIIMLTYNPADTIVLNRNDHVIYYGPNDMAGDIKKTRNVHQVRDFQQACDVLAWVRYDMETALEPITPERKTAHKINWTHYPDGDRPAL